MPHRPDLRLAITLCELRLGQRQPSQWWQDTHENGALWWLGVGIRPSRRCWYEFRERLGPLLDSLNAHIFHQAVAEDLPRVERGALDGSAVAAKTVYRLRKQTIELLCADFKEHRGLRRFSGHGLVRVRTELAFEILVHNLLVLHRCLRQKHDARQIESLTEEKVA